MRMLCDPLTYPSSASRNKSPGSVMEEEMGEAASTNTTIMTVSHIVQGPAVDLREAAAKKQVWNSE